MSATDSATGTFSRLRWKIERHARNQTDRGFLGRLCGEKAAGQMDLNGYRGELAALMERVAAHADAAAIDRGICPDFAQMAAPGGNSLLMFYAIIRLQRPALVIETGCATGLTAAVVLHAMTQNNAGRLISIDIPAQKGQFEMAWSLPEGLEPGFLVPPSLSQGGRWSLVLENARTALPRILATEEFREVDVFCHDSDHSFAHQMWEYLTVWPHLSRNGLLLSDDIAWSPAFLEFSHHVNRPMAIHGRSANFGGIRRFPAL